MTLEILFWRGTHTNEKYLTSMMKCGNEKLLK